MGVQHTLKISIGLISVRISFFTLSSLFFTGRNASIVGGRFLDHPVQPLATTPTGPWPTLLQALLRFGSIRHTPRPYHINDAGCIFLRLLFRLRLAISRHADGFVSSLAF